MAKKNTSSLTKLYLILYNVLQEIGWILLFGSFLNYYISYKATDISLSLYENVKWPLVVCQIAALLEILHAAIKIVPSNTKVVALQVTMRILNVCAVMSLSVNAQNSLGFPITLTAWCITEIIRYGYYSLHLLNALPYFLTWLRYTAFIILYPVGATGEMICLYAAQQQLSETELWSIKLMDYTFNPRYVLIMAMFSFPIILPKLYMHMFSQRRKMLGEQPKSTKKINKKKNF